jgi:hypothetical protein
MMSLKEVLAWIKTLNTKFDNYYIGTLDSKNDKSLGVYNLKRESVPVIAIGGLQCTKYAVKKISLLIHWNNASDETEEQAILLFEELLGIRVERIGKHEVYFVGMLTNGPIDVGRDDKGICEYVIELEIYYKR